MFSLTSSPKERLGVSRQESALTFARQRLAEAEAQQRAWHREGTFDHMLGLRALLMAQIADLDHRTQPAGANLAGMLAYLNTFHPPTHSGDAGTDEVQEDS